MGIFDRLLRRKKDTSLIKPGSKISKKPSEKESAVKSGKEEKKIIKKAKQKELKKEKAVPKRQTSGQKEEKIILEKQKEIAKPRKVNKEDTKEAYRILLRPLITEKATNLGTLGKYIFEVAKGVSKIEIKKAIRDLYGVNVVQVNIVSQGGKAVRYGRSTGRTKDWKKAIITLKPGEKIEIYEGV